MNLKFVFPSELSPTLFDTKPLYVDHEGVMYYAPVNENETVDNPQIAGMLIYFHLCFRYRVDANAQREAMWQYDPTIYDHFLFIRDRIALSDEFAIKVQQSSV